MADLSVANPTDHSGVRFPPPLIYIGVFAVGLFLQHFFPVSVLSGELGRALALICIGIGVIFIVWSISLFRHARTSLVPVKPSTALVTSGPYRCTRNPMYLGLACLYVGLALWFAIFWAVILFPIVIVVVQYYVIAREERYLERKFAEDYLNYKVRVRRWL